MSDAGGNVGARHAHLRLERKRVTFFLKKLEKPIRRRNIVAGDVGPNIDQVLFGSGCASQAGLARAHRSVLAALTRRRASFLIASIDLKRSGPLAIPSCQS